MRNFAHKLIYTEKISFVMSSPLTLRTIIELFYWQNQIFVFMRIKKEMWKYFNDKYNNNELLQFFFLKKILVIFASNVAGVISYMGLLYVVGGDDGSTNLSSVEVYCPKMNSWRTLSRSMCIGRSYAGAALVDKPCGI